VEDLRAKNILPPETEEEKNEKKHLKPLHNLWQAGTHLLRRRSTKPTSPPLPPTNFEIEKEIPLKLAIFQKCCTYLEENALNEPGIFRIAASSTQIKELYLKFAKQEFSVDGLDVHVVACTLKTYLRKQRDPLIPSELYHDFLQAQATEPEASRVSMLKENCLSCVPHPRNKILHLLIGLLVKISKNAEKNQMTPINLGIVFGPTIMWNKTPVEYDGLSHVNQLVTTFIENYDVLFPPSIPPEQRPLSTNAGAQTKPTRHKHQRKGDNRRERVDSHNSSQKSGNRDKSNTGTSSDKADISKTSESDKTSKKGKDVQSSQVRDRSASLGNKEQPPADSLHAQPHTQKTKIRSKDPLPKTEDKGTLESPKTKSQQSQHKRYRGKDKLSLSSSGSIASPSASRKRPKGSSSNPNVDMTSPRSTPRPNSGTVVYDLIIQGLLLPEISAEKIQLAQKFYSLISTDPHFKEYMRKISVTDMIDILTQVCRMLSKVGTTQATK